MTIDQQTLVKLEQHLAGCAVTLKPSGRRTGIEAWFPYYAGYSSEFVRQALAGLGVEPGWRVLDPWNGSGTTTAIADALGCDALGLDINPVAALVAAARLARAEDATHSAGLASQLLTIATDASQDVVSQDPLLAWLSPRLTRRYRGLESAILVLLGSRAGKRVDLAHVTPPPFAAFFLLCLIRAAKRFIRLKGSSNPTWITPEKRGDARAESLDRAFLAMIDTCARDADDAARTRPLARATGSAVALADARSLPLPQNSVDAIVTSPPYCTRIDYFRATLFELAALGIAPSSDRFRELRSQAMGTNLMRPKSVIDVGALPSLTQKLLRRIKTHPSKASDSYYYRSFAQYFDDAAQAMCEIHRVLRPGRGGLMVVQSSYYKDIPISLGKLYCSLAAQAGLSSRVVHRVPVRRVLATINSRATRHEPDRRYTEDVVALYKAA